MKSFSRLALVQPVSVNCLLRAIVEAGVDSLGAVLGIAVTDDLPARLFEEPIQLSLRNPQVAERTGGTQQLAIEKAAHGFVRHPQHLCSLTYAERQTWCNGWRTE